MKSRSLYSSHLTLLLSVLMSYGMLSCSGESSSTDEAACTAEKTAECQNQQMLCFNNQCMDTLCDDKICEEYGTTCYKGNCVFVACKGVDCGPGHACSEDGKCYTDSDVSILITLNNTNNHICDDGSCSVKAGIILSTKPAYDVIITLSLDGEGASDVVLDKSQIVFNKDNWDTTQYIGIQGIADNIEDGDKTLTLTASSSSEDVSYNQATASVELVSIDTDKPNLFIDMPDLPKTSENGDSVDIKVRLTVKPSGEVTIPISLSTEDYGTLNQSSIVFNESNWDTWQTITITGVDDGDEINTIPHIYFLYFGEMISTDERYHGIKYPSILIENTDNDNNGRPLIYVYPSKFEVSENETTDSINVLLSDKPKMSTKIKLSIMPETECAIVSDRVLEFTENNYDFQQTITIKGINDPIIDGDVPCFLTLEGDSNDPDPSTSYKNIFAFVQGINYDNEKLSVELSDPLQNLSLSENGMVDYPASVQACFVLTSKPKAPVNLSFRSSNDSTGFTVNPNTMILDENNYNDSSNCVTLTAIDDGMVDGLVPGILIIQTTSDDEQYTDLFESFNVPVYDRNSKTILSDFSDIPSSVVENDPTRYRFATKLGYKPSGEFNFYLDCVNSDPSISCDRLVKFSTYRYTLQKDDWDEWQYFNLDIIDNNYADKDNTIQVHVRAVTPDSHYALSTDKHFIVIRDDEVPGINLNCYLMNPFVDPDTLPDGQFNRDTDNTGELNCTVALTQRPAKPIEIELSYSDIPDTDSITISYEPVVFKKKLQYVSPSTINKTYGNFTVTATSKADSYAAPSVTSSPMWRYYTGHYYYFGYNGNTSDGFHHSGSVQKASLRKGVYGLRAWGASGGLAYQTSGEGSIYKMNQFNPDSTFKCKNSGGYGHYISGRLTLEAPETMYVYVGGAGTSYTGSYIEANADKMGGYNGGSSGSNGDSGNRGVGGGGATDFCIGHADCKTQSKHYPYRVLVAGGGGGAVQLDCTDYPRSGGCADIYHSGDIYTHGHTRRDGNDVYSYIKNSQTYYYAPFGGRGNYNFTLIDSVANYFGNAMSPSSNSDARPFGGGGGGYFGGHVNNYTSETKVGGGAGSSYIFTGSFVSNYDKQISKFKLSTDTSDFSIIESHATCIPNLTTKRITCNPISGTYVTDTRRAGSPKGRYGDGFALIEVLNIPL